jgi:Mg-chelatase subunit ChlD
MNAIVAGSLSQLAGNKNMSLAESFMSAEVIIVCDTSGSMGTHDSRGGKSRYDVACEELAALQGSMPGKIAVISFASEVTFCPNGVPFNYGSGTDLAGALTFVKAADMIPGMKFILVSDGEPDDQASALRVASQFKNKIDVIFVGNEKSPTGRAFLEKLAKTTGGQTVTAEAAKTLAAQVQVLLLKG